MNLDLPNPGYPVPEGVMVLLRGGMRVPAKVTFDQVVMDKGVPTPRFLVSLPDDLSIEHYNVEALEVRKWPPGTILAFDQRGNPQENAERIVEQSRRNAMKNLTMRRTEQ